jgi:hypothetical protein
MTWRKGECVNSIDPTTLFEISRDALIQDECQFGYMVCEDHLSELALLHRTIEGLITSEEEREVNSLAEVADQLPERRRSKYWADNHPWWWEHIIAPQFRASFLMTLMSAVELHLSRFARDGATIVRAPLSADDLKGGIYKRTRRFFRLYCQFTQPSDAMWERIGDLYDVRNALVHAGGFPDGPRGQRITRFAAKTPELCIQSGRIELSREFNELALAECSSFLTEIWEELAKLCRRS